MECLECYKRTEFHHFNNTEHTHVISTNLLENNVFQEGSNSIEKWSI